MKSALELFTQLTFVFFSTFIISVVCIAESQQAVDRENKSITLALTSEPPKLNTLISQDATSFFIIDHLTEGLMRHDQNNKLIGGVAEKWELSDDGATFWLRKDAKWQDGKPVTAHDFVFAWREVLKPETASAYAFILYPITNAKAINEGKLPAEKLGVKAINDYQLEVTLHQPTAYFLDLTAFITYRPIREDAIKKWGRAYAADADNILSNGPFILTDWIHGASLKMKKNPYYWEADKVTLDTINIPYITSDSSALFNLFLEDKIATWITPSLAASNMKKALKKHLPIYKFQSGAVYYLEFNHRKNRITANKNFRKALQYIIDPTLYTNKVLGNPGNTPAQSLFPKWLKGAEKPLHVEYPLKPIITNIAKAKIYLEKAKKELGLKAFPPLFLLIDDGGGTGGNKTGEYLQELLADTLGLDIRIDKQIFKLRLEKQRKGQYDILLAGWGPDFNDPMTYADLLFSENSNNSGKYNNPVYDNLIITAQATGDQKKRAKIFGEIQEIIQEEVPVLPLYYRGDVYLQHPRLTNVKRQIFGGDPIFTYAEIAPKESTSR